MPVQDHARHAAPAPSGPSWAAHIPNLLTVGRVLAVPILIALLYRPERDFRLVALALFVLASLTDFVDGWLARRLNVQSRFGTMLDPIADKLIVATILVMLVATDTIAGPHVVAVLLILGREIFVSGLREFLAGERISVPVTALAKWKTALQMAAIAALLLFADLPGLGWTAALVLLWLAAAVSVYTGAAYATALRPAPKGATRTPNERKLPR